MPGMVKAADIMPAADESKDRNDRLWMRSRYDWLAMNDAALATLGDDADPRGTLVDQVAALIQADILAGEHPIGSRLRQSALAARYGVSRTPIREALQQLQAASLIELRPHAGAIVRGPTAREVRETYQVHAELEGLATELAASWITQRQLDQLKETERLFSDAIATLEAATPANVKGRAAAEEKWRTANDRFHEVIHEAAGNRRLRATIKDMHRSFPRPLRWATLTEDLRLLAENCDEHRAIREALDRRAADDARRLMMAHVRRAGERVARWLERQES